MLMLSFRQYVEAVQFPEFKSNSNIESILRPLPNKEIVYFVLEVAEDVFHLNDDRRKQLARTCLDLLHQWLDDPKSVSSERLRSASSAAWSAAASAASTASNAATYAASAANAANATTYAANAAAYAAAANAASAAAYANAAANAAASAYAAYARASGQYDQSIYGKQLARYRQWAINLRAEVTHNPDTSQLSKLLDAALKTRDKSMWYAVWDAASEQGLLPDNINREDVEKNPMNFYHMLKRIIS